MRYPDWPQRLAKVIAVWEGLPFRWGRTDCACFGNAVVMAMTGRDELAKWRGAYDSAASAKALLQLHQQATLAHAVSQALGRSIPPFQAQRGDLVMVAGGLGVCLGARAAVRRDRAGLLYLPMREAVCAWQIG